MYKNFWKAALIRALRTVAQAAIAFIGSSAVLSEVNWLMVLSGAVLAGIISLLTSIATGLPEVDMYFKAQEDLAKDNEECYVQAVKECNELREELYTAEEEEHDDE